MSEEETPFCEQSINQKIGRWPEEFRESYLHDMRGREIGLGYEIDQKKAREEAEELEAVRAKIFSSESKTEKFDPKIDEAAIEEVFTHYRDKGISLQGEDAVFVRRLYGSLRRMGLSPTDAKSLAIEDSESAQEKRNKIHKVLGIHSTGSENKRKNAVLNKEKKRIVEELGYKEELDNPEEYFYHSSSSEDLRSFAEQGLVHSLGQPTDLRQQIDFWNGSQGLHECIISAWHGYGFGGTFLRVKKEVLERNGFELVPFESGSPATRAWRKNPEIPPQDLEVWDKKYKLWRPILDVAKEMEEDKI